MKIAHDNSIDFVLTWVDGGDPEWQQDFVKYTSSERGDKRVRRYRDWNNLHYLLRGLELFAPWHRKLFLVTYGHIPKWLNIENDKLVIVRHEDFIDRKFLPVFSANPLEVNFHTIPGLAEKFVYFNDDTFLLKPVSEKRFFSNGLPCDVFSFNALSDSEIAHLKLNDVQVLHRHFDKYDVVMKNFFKVFNYKVGLVNLLKTLLLMPWPKLTGFYDHHLAQPFLKSTFRQVWELERDVLEKTERTKVRSNNDVNQYLFRYWQLCSGQFTPIRLPRHHFEWIRNLEDARSFSQEILNRKSEMVCINDGVGDSQSFEVIRDCVNSAFDTILPDKCSYEL